MSFASTTIVFPSLAEALRSGAMDEIFVPSISTSARSRLPTFGFHSDHGCTLEQDAACPVRVGAFQTVESPRIVPVVVFLRGRLPGKQPCCSRAPASRPALPCRKPRHDERFMNSSFTSFRTSYRLTYLFNCPTGMAFGHTFVPYTLPSASAATPSMPPAGAVG